MNKAKIVGFLYSLKVLTIPDVAYKRASEIFIFSCFWEVATYKSLFCDQSKQNNKFFILHCLHTQAGVCQFFSLQSF